MSLDSRYFVTGSNDNTVKVWDCNTWSPKWTFKDRYRFCIVAISPLCKHVAGCHRHGEVCIWALATKHMVGCFKIDGTETSVLTFSSDSMFILAVDFFGQQFIWDISLGCLVETADMGLFPDYIPRTRNGGVNYTQDAYRLVHATGSQGVIAYRDKGFENWITIKGSQYLK